MRIVIVGNSILAVELTKLVLKKNENKITLVVKKKEEAMRLTSELNISVINADPTNPDHLDELELEKCDVFIAATDLEKENVLSAIYAKNAGAKKIYVSIENEESELILKKLGFIPLRAEEFAAQAIELMISRPQVSAIVNIHEGEFDMIEVEANETELIGKEMGSAKGIHYTTLATYDGKYLFDKETIIKENDILLVVVSSGMEKIAEKEIKKKTGLIEKMAKNLSKKTEEKPKKKTN
ncbi:MAG TPA: NAD-binding protein [archaeon]|nr:NAD-binding protein [archaeon]